MGTMPAPDRVGTRPDTPRPVPGPINAIGARVTGDPPPTCQRSSSRKACKDMASAEKSFSTIS